MLNQQISDELVSFFERLLAFYKEFLNLEKKKYDILKTNNLSLLDQLLRDEQAFTLKAKGFEAERRSLLDQTEKPQAVFRELIPLFGPEYRDNIRKMYHELDVTLNNLKLTNDRCNRLTKLKLRRIDFLKSRVEKRPAGQNGNTYDGKMVNEGRTDSLISKKI